MVHPRNKKVVGERLAAAALSVAYNMATPYLPPTYNRSTAITATPSPFGAAPPLPLLTVAVSFANVPTALVTAADHCKTELKVPNQFCAWFSITGSDTIVRNATATIGTDGRSLVLTAMVPAKEGVVAASTGFGWNAWPINTIMTAEGLPLQPWKDEPVHLE